MGPPLVRAGRLLLALGVLALVAAAAVDLGWGRRVTLLARLRPAAEREAWRREVFDPRDDPAEIYGVVEPPPDVRVVVFRPDRLLHPPEAPGRALLPVDRAAGEDVLLARTLWARSLLAGGATALLGLVLVAAGAGTRLPRGKAGP